MVDKPLVSVVMPMFNAAKTLATAVDSICKQTYKNIEIIIIDDASTDTSKNVLKSIKDLRIRYLKNTLNIGVAASLNLGIKKARGKYIARMDADDISLPTRIEKQLSYLETHPRVAAAGSWAAIINSAGNLINVKQTPTGHKKIRRVIMRFNPIIHPTLMIRKNILQQMGLYNVNLNGAEDYDLLLKLVPIYSVINLPQILVKQRFSPTSVTFKHMKWVEKQALRARFIALKKYGYPPWQLIYLIKPIISFFIPAKIKKVILRCE